MRSKNQTNQAPVSEFMKKMSPEESCAQMPLVASLMAHICLLNSVLERAGDRRAAEHGLTLAQWLALGCAGHAGDEGVTHSELGQRLMLSKAPITGVVDRLERGGYVVRAPDGRDRRVSRVKITPKGSETWETVRDSLHKLAAEMCESISEEEIAQTQNLLVHLLENTARIDPTLTGEKSGGNE